MLDIRHLHKKFGNYHALDDINVSAGSDEFVCLLGPSGCGKTTLLRIVAGLESYSDGEILFDGRDLNAIDVRNRNFGIVFQSYSLFPGMTVGENIGYGLKIRNVPRAEIEKQVRALLDIIRFPDLIGRYPHELSGGQQQRVAIARALAVSPSLLLLDEPLSALDARVRLDIRGEIRDLQRRLAIPTIMVTHDQEEALSMADKVVCMNHGRIEQVGTPHELYFRPRTKFVASFIGTSNFLDVTQAGAVFGERLSAVPQEGRTPDALLVVRPEELVLTADPAGEATVADVTFLGNVSHVRLGLNGRTITSELRLGQRLAPGERVSLSLHDGCGRWVAP
ncbi:ABC transporter ATP-binding protein [Shinella sp.]|uniref:ABC transporter ATP-binding protein n=1 Tax=Shinella sp. TaxID=1870904 RepID=UPI0039E69812